VTTWNANRPHGFGVLNPDNFAPYPKNPVIGAFFREIDRADELGSGMRKMMMYGKKYGGADPQLIEGDVFRMIISVPEFGKKPLNTLGREPATFSSGPESIFKRVIRELLIGSRSKSELATALGQKSVSGKLNERIREMLADGLIPAIRVAKLLMSTPLSNFVKSKCFKESNNLARFENR
jgi:ATP-dependent DNA helicase RecG